MTTARSLYVLIMFIFSWKEYESDVDEETLQFILDQNTETRKLLINDVNKQLY